MSDRTFEQRLARLEDIVAQLEGDELELARALALFEEGVKQLREASAELSRTETKLKVLTERADGTLAALEPRG